MSLAPPYSHRYKGRQIQRCIYLGHQRKWIIRLYHEASGLPLADELCPHFQTAREAKAAIDEELQP